MIGENDGVPSITIKHYRSQEILLQEEGYFKTPYIGQHGWTSCYINNESNWEAIEGFILEAFNLTAPKRPQIQ